MPQLQTIKQINDVISAEVSPVSADQDEERYCHLVLQHMVHRYTQACQDGECQCRKKFPKPITERTFIDDRGTLTTSIDVLITHNHHLLMLADYSKRGVGVFFQDLT